MHQGQSHRPLRRSFSLFSSDPLLTSDARTYLTRNPLLKSCSPPTSCPLSISLSLSFHILPIQNNHPNCETYFLHRLLIALSQPRRHASLTPIGDVSLAMSHRPIHLHHTSASCRQLPPCHQPNPCTLSIALGVGWRKTWPSTRRS